MLLIEQKVKEIFYRLSWMERFEENFMYFFMPAKF